MENNGQTNKHIPVLAKQVLELLVPDPAAELCIIDGTVGFGGHASMMLQKAPRARLLGIDRDETALEAAADHLSFAEGRVTLKHARFSGIADAAAEVFPDGADAILLDIGVSSPQIDTAERGFSFRFPGAPLDMRMDRSARHTAAELLNLASEEELTRIFRDYGEIREAARLAREIVHSRIEHPLAVCGDFAAVCDRILGGRKGGRKGPPAPTLPFQAIRIAVNDELGELQKALDAALSLLRPGGRLGVISFHSLEDRIVKNFFRDMAAECKCPPGCPVCICGWKPKLKIITKKPCEADAEEASQNPRSACAKLRIAERLPDTVQKNTEIPVHANI